MNRSKLFVTFREESIQYVEVDERPGGMFPGTPELAASNEALLTAAERADRIYLAADFRSFLNEWQLFPKVKDSHLFSLVQRDAQDKSTTSSPLEVRCKSTGEVAENGITQKLVNYVALPRPAIDEMRGRFGKHARKIEQIVPMSMGLASLVCQTHKPAHNFFMIWAGAQDTMIAIVTPDGLVKLHRSIPVSCAGINPDDSADFAAAIGRELAMTSAFCKQKLRLPPPEAAYVFGQDNLAQINEKHPLASPGLKIVFGLSPLQNAGITESFANEYAHLLCNNCPLPAFNFIPRDEIVGKRLVRGSKVAIAVLALGIIVSGAWAMRVVGNKQNQLDIYARNLAVIGQLQGDIARNKKSLAEFTPLLDRYSMYKNRFIDQPPWGKLLYQLSDLVPPEVIITGYKLFPAGGHWHNVLHGELRAANWQDGLAVLRTFGRKVNASPLYSVDTFNYKFGALTSEPKAYNFTMELTLAPGVSL
ncbi:MAG: hypothetical protein GXP59_10185 [Deltaproteobacteria bacterium]|nr:hypothetical protein [Deltaproteobacteria bacterium]